VPSSRDHAPDRAISVPRTSRDDVSRRRVTLAIIAAEAGVSLPTVSKVVNRRPDVAAATRAEMGRAAAQMLGEIIEDRPLRSRRVELSTELITRESTGPVPGAGR
jgi:DNA-binding LacI/PurR family transcriptional regulator